MKPTILVVDDERNIRRSLDMILVGEGYTVLCAESGAHAAALAEQHRPDAVILDIVLPDVDGIEVLKRIKAQTADLPVIMISGHGTVQDAVQATRLGAYDFLEKPLSKEKVLLTLEHALQVRSLAEENRSLRQEAEARFEMIGDSPAMRAIRDQVGRVAPTSGRVLILGESGTGKELIARAVHRNSRCADGPFIRVNCAAIPEELIESELFGSDRGAFTGAVKTRDGKFLQADGGTLFLDEIGDMSLNVQAKVLRALEQGEFERVGGSQTIRVDVRVLAATNRDISRLVEGGRFREDLYFRLNVVPIFVPPLRERRDDIPPLIGHFARQYAEENGFRQKAVSEEAMEILCAYAWPGNIRELRNLVERLSIMVSGETIRPSDLPDDLRAARAIARANVSAQGKSLREIREQVERDYIRAILEEHGWNVTQAARELGIERTNLHKKIKFYGIEKE
ncbi:MAG: Fis family transcriptional regulator [Candidatus Handelsmanbacteria bacterium RIFCSPLOWO2_12_FULL_64_10]|uniref:Fis family transcriptional regulator n=1 Tax=Handelsmanbacteria sp. (strain RIFCSPLOWO2_12_FULL_64_10) TaxID=1817868 RepID=A0A1F6CUF5_HANXR|nr:MAG: Fis family transcriptional regulator [Candidatus Handelsmanbacteria bacterium RIFCSPLOWO2_12_FULL_64_10]